MKLIYNVKDRPAFREVIVFSFQQLLAIMAATIAVPAIVGNGMTASAALFGAGIGTLVYQLFTKFRSPVFLGSSFAFLGSMAAAFAGAASMSLGYFGLVLGAFFAGAVYVVIALIVHIAGVNWINRLMPAVVIGPTVAIIGLSLAGNAVGDMKTADAGGSVYAALICAFITLFVVIACSVFGKKQARLIPFIIGILAGYAAALVMTVIGSISGNESLKIIDFAPFHRLVENGVSLATFLSLPKFTFIEAAKSFKQADAAYIGSIAVAYIPVAFVVFAEHIADHKNLSTIIDVDLLKDPGLTRTLLGDGIGSFAGAVFGGCPNTTYGESIGCVAITKNASIISITGAAVLCLLISFIAPIVAFLDSIPACVMGGVCMTLYGFIAVSGLKMLQPVDLNDNRNLFIASVILISGVGGLSISFGRVTITTVACSLILGIITSAIVSRKKDNTGEDEPQQLIK